MENVLFQTSLIASFVAGMVALFAPCCITFLLPAYLGSVFREKEKVLFMTLIFGLGIAAILLPAVLGVAIISKLVFRFHNSLYIAGGLVLVLVSAVTFLGIKSPFMIGMKNNTSGKTDVLSIFILGIFSGITSACCAPVLVGILAFAMISPNFWAAMLVGLMYVLGMVAPLFIMSLFLSGKVDKLAILKKKVFGLSFFGNTYRVTLSNLIASIIFLITGLITLYLATTGKLTMENTENFSRMILSAGGSVNDFIGNNFFINFVFLAVVIFVIYKIFKKI